MIIETKEKDINKIILANGKVLYQCGLCGFTNESLRGVKYHYHFCKERDSWHDNFKTFFKLSITEYTTEITLKWIDMWEKIYKKKFPDEYIEGLIECHKKYKEKFIKNNSLKGLMTVTPSYYINFRKAMISEKMKSVQSKNGKKLYELNKSLDLQFSRIGGINCIKLHPEISKKGMEACKTYWKEHPEELHEHAIQIGFKKANLYWKEHPEEASERGHKAGLASAAKPKTEKQIEAARRNGYAHIDNLLHNKKRRSAEEEKCRKELEEYFGIKLNSYIWVVNPDPSTINPLTGVRSKHPYDFGIKDKKFLIEYDGWWHTDDAKNKIKDLHIQEADRYWSMVAKEKGYILYRIDSEKWKNTNDKKIILNDLENILHRLEVI